MEKLDAVQVSKALMSTVNGYSRELPTALATAVITDHRTLQSDAIAAMTRALYQIGKRNHGSDARNHYAIKLCQTLATISDTGTASDEDIRLIQCWFTL